ncbi:MAG: LD-carboxypeptidase [Gammaproteobacteria bacterium]|nr:LD-carboxypeptidase [Gammaproteobacteria bacterium]
MNALPLQKGDTIGLVSPSSPLMMRDIKPGIQFLEQNGFKIKFGHHLYDAERFLAGKDEDRAKDLLDFFKDPEVKAIVASRGGHGSQRLLPLLDYQMIHTNPKKLVGFSDTTALQLGLFKKTGLISYTGFSLTSKRSGLVEETLISCLLGRSYHVKESVVVHSGLAEGLLIGGNLTLLTNLMGTPYQPNFKNCILLLEDVGNTPYNVDGMFSQLDLAGVFDQVAGIILGEFEDCVSKAADCHDGSVEDVLHEWSARFNVPCIKNFPYGHGTRNCVLPMGGLVSLNASTGCLTVTST